jgi:hypothetical protein
MLFCLVWTSLPSHMSKFSSKRWFLGTPSHTGFLEPDAFGCERPGRAQGTCGAFFLRWLLGLSGARAVAGHAGAQHCSPTLPPTIALEKVRDKRSSGQSYGLEIAEAVGIASIYEFSRFFQRKTGRSATAYRNRGRTGPAHRGPCASDIARGRGHALCLPGRPWL